MGVLLPVLRGCFSKEKQSASYNSGYCEEFTLYLLSHMQYDQIC